MKQDTDNFLRDKIRTLLQEDKLGATGRLGKASADMKKIKSMATDNPKQLLSNINIGSFVPTGSSNAQKAASLLKVAFSKDVDLAQVFSSDVSLSGSSVICNLKTTDVGDSDTPKLLIPTGTAAKYVLAILIAGGKMGYFSFEPGTDDVRHSPKDPQSSNKVFANLRD